MSRARKIWKWTAAAAGALLVLAAVAIGGFRIWLENSPELPAEIVLRVEKLTGLRFAFTHLDARLGLGGPELVFRSARITVPGQSTELITAGAGRVGFDVWRSLRTGRLAAGRLVLEGARVHLIVTSEGVELRGQGDLGAADGAHLKVGDLPVGRVRIEDATVTVEDLRSAARPWSVDRVNLDLERDPSALILAGNVRLPDALGARLSFEARLAGDLAKPAELAWHGGLNLKSASLAGWTALMPDWAWLPSAGHGDLKASASGTGSEIASASATFGLDHLLLRGVAGAPPPALAELGGSLEVRHDGGRWTVEGRGLNVNAGGATWRGGELNVGVGSDAQGLKDLALASPSVRLDALAALAALLPDGVVREAGLALAPKGVLTGLDLKVARGAHAGEWRIEGGVAFAGLALGAWRAVPGLAGLEGEFKGQGANGRVSLRSHAFTLDLPRILTAPVRSDEVGATLDWWWQPDGWRFATDDLHSKSADGRGAGTARLWLPSDGESPRLVLDLNLTDIEARTASRYLPGRTIPPKAMAWLEAAFLGGRVHDVHFEFAGPTREFPFRDGGGLFRIRLAYSGMRIHYQDGFADVEDATGDGEFRNQGFTAHATHARIGGLDISNANAAMQDFATAELTATAGARGDLAAGLAYLQGSPIGPKLGSYFMKIAGHGPMSAEVALDLPLPRFAERHITVNGHLEHARATLPGIAEEATGIDGSFVLRDRELEVREVTATLLGNAVRASAHTIAGPSGAAGDRLLLVEAQGRASGEHLQPVVGITRGRWLSGGFDWHAQARIPRFEWSPPPDALPADAPANAIAPPHEIEVRWLPTALHLESGLAGLAIALPAPLAKAAEEVRNARFDVVIDPGLEAGAPALPPKFRRGGTVRDGGVLARVQLGHDAGALEWRFGSGEFTMKRGTLRFGGGTPVLRDSAGVWLEGRMPAYDLSAWLGVRLSEGTGKGLAEYLKGGTVLIDRFDVFGFRFPDVTLALEAGKGEWRAHVEGPAALGTIVVPWEMKGPAPLSLDLDRLLLGERVVAAGATGSATDPTELPPLAIAVRDLEIQKRHFGTLEAAVSRTEDGLQLDTATLKGASFHASGRGSWVLTASGQASAVSFTLESTDVQDTLNAWGFAQTLSGKSGRMTAELKWPGGIDADVLSRLGGSATLRIDQGQLYSVAPGAGRVLGLLSVGALPRRLLLDFTDLTDQGFAFDSVKGDFEFREGNAYTSNLVLKGPAAEIGIVGRTGLVARDYDQTAKVTGHFGGPLAAAGALAAGPAIGAALLLFSTVFKEPLSGIARGYYRITGSWESPKVERIGAGAAREAEHNAADAQGR